MMAVVGTPFSHVSHEPTFSVLYLLQDEVDSQNPVLRENHQLHEEVKSWLKDQKVQEIFMQGKLFVGPLMLCHCCSLIFFLNKCFCHNAQV